MEASVAPPLLGLGLVPRSRPIGREREIATARSLLLDEAVPLLTLTGPGGVGRTRLAIVIAGGVASAFAEGVVVDLTPLTDHDLVPATVAASLGITVGAALAAHLAALAGLRLGYIDQVATDGADARAGIASFADRPWRPGLMCEHELHRGWIALLQGDVHGAHEILDALAVNPQARARTDGGAYPEMCWILLFLAHVTRIQRDYPAALAPYRAALDLSWQFRHGRCVASALGGVAGILVASGAWSDAAHLYGAAEAFCERNGLHFPDLWHFERAVGLPEPWQRATAPLDAAASLVRPTVLAHGWFPLPPLPDPDQAKRDWDSGRELTVESAMSLALARETAPEAMTG